MNLHISFVQPERELIYVALQMFPAEGVVGSIEPAFQDRPDALNTVRGLGCGSISGYSLPPMPRVTQLTPRLLVMCIESSRIFSTL